MTHQDYALLALVQYISFVPKISRTRAMDVRILLKKSEAAKEKGPPSEL